MESNKKYVIGLDFGTDSCRALVVDTYTGREMATGVSFYPRWKAGLYCDAHNNRYRQHPLDYIESMTEAVHIALSDLKEEEIASICGLCFDTTGSTPALTDKAGMPLALCPEFAEEPDAMFILWKDHTAVREAEQINALGTVTIASKAGDEGKLFGSVGTRDIADAVTAAGVNVAKSEVRLPNGVLRNVGEHEVDFQVHSEVFAKVIINVVAE